MKKRFLSILLSLCMVLALVPVTAFAEDNEEPTETPVCICEAVCAAEAMNADCPVCGAECATAEKCGKYEAPVEETEPEQTAIEKVQALIDALPDADSITEENRADVEAQLTAIDEAKFPLSDELDALDFTKYQAAINALDTLDGQTGASEPETLDDSDYTSLQTKLNNNATVTLDKDYSIDQTLTISKTVTLDLNGHVIKRTGSGRVIKVSEGANLTMEDSSTAQTGMITGGNGSGGGGGVYVAAGGAFTMESGTIFGCTNTMGGGVYIAGGGNAGDGRFTMKGGTITGCTATVRGGGVENGGTFDMQGGTITGCTATKRGSGVYNAGDHTLENTSTTGSATICYGTLSNSGKTNGKLVQFYNGDDLYAWEVVPNEGNAVDPTAPTNSGCTFDGWYTAQTGGTKFEFNTSITKDITLYAKWVCAGHTGGTATCKDRAVCDYCGEPYGEIDISNHVGGTEVRNAKDAKCTEDGYTGDTYCKDCDMKLQDGKPITKLGHIDADKNHVCDRENCKATLSTCSGGTATCKDRAVCDYCGEPYGELDSSTHAGGTYIKNDKAATCNEDGYTGDTYCKGCATKLQDGKPITKLGHIDADKNHVCDREYCKATLSNHDFGEDGKCECGAVQYTVTFDPNGGTVDPTSATTDAYGKLTELPTPTRSGSYRFDGWFTEKNGGTAVTVDTVFTAHTTVYAHWTYTGSTAPDYCVIKATAGEGGSITPSGRAAVLYGASKTFTITPNDGYAIADVKVDGKSVGAVKTYTFERVRGDHTIEAVFMKATGNPQTGVDVPFTDVSENDWFYEDVAYVYANDLMKGTSETTFSPTVTTTRGMIVTILYCLEGEPTVSDNCPFADVKSGSYYEKAITWAAANEIVSGYGNGKFGPDDAITREQMAVILYRYTQYKGMDVSVGEDTNILSYNDALDISEYAFSAMQWACGESILNGSDGNLMPQGNATRAQVAAILHRFCENILK